ncbi:MAG: pentapeptide repeat-containing protein [Rickettsia endosymbiont of Labidopullus appendiculatus]|nr:pentapeptide repeat-containing protein [Rickettsia endosymbiont of Labidopullus appendiculatus]
MKQIYKFCSQKVKIALRILFKIIQYGIIAIRIIYKLLLRLVFGIIQVCSIILNKFKFLSLPKVTVYRNMIIKLLSGYVVLYTVAFGRYQLSVLALDNKVSRLVALSEGKNPKLTFERIPYLQQETVPVEPIFFQPLSIWKSFNPKYNQVNIEIFKDLRFLIVNKKQNLNDLNLSGIILFGTGSNKYDTDFSESHFHNIKFFRANLSLNNFQKSEFSNVDFWGAKLLGCDFALSKFTNETYLESADFSGSNLCGVEFINASYNTAIFSNTNLIGVDLSKMLIFNTHQTNLQGAYYNSKPLTAMSGLQMELINRLNPSCSRYMFSKGFPATKFPEDFNPKEHGMIDIFEIPDDKIKEILESYY